MDLRDAIDALLPRQRELIWRHYRLDQVVAAIGRLLGISQRMAQLAHHGALRVLRVMLEVPEPPHEPRPRGDAHSCPSGHPRTPENTYIYPEGATECKVCRREGARRRRRARRTQPMKYAKRRPVKVG